MPYICMSRADIQDGILQVLDLQPNVSQRNPIYDPAGQTKYVNRVQNDTLAALSANLTVAQYKGLAAYLIDHVEDNTANVAITVTVANAAALGIIVIMDAAGALNAAGIAAALVAAGAGAGTSLIANGSDGAVVDLLKILAGAEYVLPAGSLIGGVAGGPSLGAFTTGQYRATYDTGALKISFGEGYLYQLCQTTYTYGGVAHRAVTVYANDGTVYTG